VGRIEIDGHPNHEWVGTGFLVAPDIVMTNRHVAIEFARREDGSDAWIFEPGMTARIDYVEELSATTQSEWTFEEVIGMHPERDIALLRIAPGADPPPPLTILGSPPGGDIAGRQVFLIGYPTWDGRRNDPQVIQRIFTNIFDVKRLQPGLIGEFEAPKRLFTHDASTLAGNSGSCVVDLDSGVVFGLHFRGKYLEANRAVALWTMTEDSLIKPAGLNFV
jgi:S1-C subfamily serine protease